MTASSIWHFRCSLLHEGTTDLDKKGDLDKVLFAHPQGGVHVQDGLLRVGDERFAVTDMLAFTGAVCNAADGWLARSRNTEPVKTNLTRLLSLTPGQLFGTPVTFVG